MATPAELSDPTSADGTAGRHLLHHSPAGDWVEGTPLGNGRLGLMLLGRTGVERVALNDDTLWSGTGPAEEPGSVGEAEKPSEAGLAGEPREAEEAEKPGGIGPAEQPGDVGEPGEPGGWWRVAQAASLAGRPIEAEAALRRMQGPFTQSYLPLGDLLIEELDAVGPVTGYRRTLALASAIATVDYRRGHRRHRREAFVSAVAGVAVIRIGTDDPAGLRLAIRLTTQLRGTTTGLDHTESSGGLDRAGGSGDVDRTTNSGGLDGPGSPGEVPGSESTSGPGGDSGPARNVGSGGATLVLAGEAPSHVDPDYVDSAEPVRYGGGMGFAVALRVTADPDQAEPSADTVALAGSLIETVSTTRSLAGTASPVEVRVDGAREVVLLLATATGFAGPGCSPDTDPQRAARAALARIDAVRADYHTLRAEHIAEHRGRYGGVHLDLGPAPSADGRPCCPEAAPGGPAADVGDLAADSGPLCRPETGPGGPGADPGPLCLPARLDRYRAGGDDPDLAALLFDFGRYLLLASSRPGSQPANLQGIWNAQLQPPWSANYTLNINTQMNYWAAEPTALGECHEPLLRLAGELTGPGARVARRLYDAPGWTVHHNTDLWRAAGPVGDGGGDPAYANWPMGAAWLAWHLWERYAYSGDLEQLATGYPVLRGAAEFCLALLVEGPDGRLLTAASTSPENRFRTPDGHVTGVGVGATMDLVLFDELATACRTAERLLGITDGLAGRLARAHRRLHRPGTTGDGRLAEWAHPVEEVEPEHRHLSHLVGLYPGRGLSPDGTSELAAAARRTLDVRGDEGTGWSLVWKVALWARLGDGERAYALLRRMLRPVPAHGEPGHGGGGVYRSLLCAHPPFQIDGNLGASAVVAEMLLQSHDNHLHLLPAVPAAWPSGSVRGLVARGGHRVAVSWAAGRLSRASVTLGWAGTVAIRYGGYGCRLIGEPGNRFSISPADLGVPWCDLAPITPGYPDLVAPDTPSEG